MRILKFVLSAGVLGVAATGQLHAQAAGRIGFIDSEVILAEAPGAAEAQQVFDAQMERFSQELERMGVELDSMVTAYQQQQSTLLQNVRQARENEIRQAEARYQQRVEEMQVDAEQNRLQLIQPILTQMSEVIEEIRAEAGYAMILDVASQAIISADPELDLTEEVLRRLAQNATATTSPSP